MAKDYQLTDGHLRDFRLFLSRQGWRERETRGCEALKARHPAQSQILYLFRKKEQRRPQATYYSTYGVGIELLQQFLAMESIK